MKAFQLKAPILLLIILSIVCSNCITIDAGPSIDSSIATGKEKQAIDALVYFSIVNQSAVLDLLEIFSDGFTQPLFSPNIMISYEDYDTMLTLMEELSAHEEPVLSALEIIVPKDLAYHQYQYASLIPPNPDSIPVYASPGIVGSFLDFFGFMGGAGKRSRNRIIEITKNSTDYEKRDLFECLSDSQRSGAKDHNEWFKKLADGEMDRQAAHIHNTFMNDENYLANASAKKERPIDATYKDGAEMVTKGAKFYVDAGTTAVGGALPGFASGVQKVQDLNDKVEKYKKYAQTFYGKGIKETVRQAVTDKFDDMLTGQMKDSLGEHLSDAVTYLTQQMTGASKPSELLDKGLKYGTAVVVDADKSKSQVAVALNKNESDPVQMVINVKGQDSPRLSLPQGEYLVTTADKDGNCTADRNVSISNGKETVIAINSKQNSLNQSGSAGVKTDVAGKIKEAIASGLKGTQEQGAASEQAAKPRGNPLLEILKTLQDAALAGLNKNKKPDSIQKPDPVVTADSKPAVPAIKNANEIKPTEFITVYEADVAFNKCVQCDQFGQWCRECPANPSADQQSNPMNIDAQQARKNMCTRYIYLTFKTSGECKLEVTTTQVCGNLPASIRLQEKTPINPNSWTEAQLTSGVYHIGLKGFPQPGQPLRIAVRSAGWARNDPNDFGGCCQSAGRVKVLFKPRTSNLDPNDILSVTGAVN